MASSQQSVPAAPRLQLPTSLPPLSAEDSAATTSPARGAEMRNFLQARLQKNRAPPLVHSWDFYHDRQDRTKATNLSSIPSKPNTAENSQQTTAGDGDDNYASRLEHLAVIDDVRKFWNVFNNFPLHSLALRDSVHLFHKGVQPIWEDPRNTRGGAWTFRVPKSLAAAFWQELCMLAIGEKLQEGLVEDQVRNGRMSFKDDVCGVSLGVRFNSMLVQIWNRDGSHEVGIQEMLRVVLDGLSDELKPREGSYYYKKHSEHAGFAAPANGNGDAAGSGSRPGTSTGASIDAVLAENA
ncbi:hypothetical protein LTR91_009350 [Friedmanniomyces endolithicus]|uniref:Translation initiation factor eIF4e n=1 Tax=Friedmanniomyces endolithicus TaxID=329885 RepID=A0AAN6KLI8_9PEZI|nr:hypothetical protein LTR35_003756 [Friedmanniomyces endolithicus]KAK0289909.1 hypothetical protein LTS00_009046 [Friedmanniomyces endolithicus]KAK0326120.1 hypothetical protein LTR82_002865 [Friedmanniomyces endolithicus]KAK0989197.1 hypothetical protein LTR91_009350 [Friedmanniomyces endolithicus]KAK1006100.1 hypothetical protein LTS01_003176 [Friedmanniomyces endolithicus]